MSRRAPQELTDGEHVPFRGGRPVTPIGPPETLDLDRHTRATVVGILAVLAMFLFASFAVGSSFREGERRVDVPRVPVPRVVGRTLEQAQGTLGPLKLLVAVRYEPNEVVPTGVVFEQRPLAGSKLEVGSEVTLVVSDGPAGVTVPDARGLQAGEAVTLLQSLGFVATLQPVNDEAIQPGQVVGTSPAAGNRAVNGAGVAVQVSNGPAPRTVPAVVDLPRAEGFAALGRSGVGLGTVTTSYIVGKVPGLIASTDPPAGAAAARDFPVNVVVTGAPPTLTVPPVTGLLQASATSVLGSGSFQVSIRSQTVPAGDPRAGRVISQSLPPGTVVTPPIPLQLVVGVEAVPPSTTTTTVPGSPTAVVPTPTAGR